MQCKFEGLSTAGLMFNARPIRITVDAIITVYHIYNLASEKSYDPASLHAL